jgi:tetratricopeptide (TPR) repeat protein
MLSKPFILGVLVVLGWSLAGPVRADSPTNQLFILRAETVLRQARQNYQADTNSMTNALALARASFTLADLATNDTQRAQVARRGIEVCRQWLAREPKSGPGHYYLAMNLGQLAKAEAPSIAAYKLVHEVEREFQTAAELDVRYDHAGPARTLGLLYFQAPGWPLSIGSKRKAREWLERAAELAPDYPGNQLNLAEAQLKWRQREELAATLKKMEAVWPAAQTNLTGESWEQAWQEWAARRTAVKSEAQSVYGGPP